MRRILTAGAAALALAGMGHNMPPAPIPATASDRLEQEHRVKRRENKKLWQKRRRKTKHHRHHRLSWSQRKGRLFKGHRP